jgi:hypothetical protein
LTGKDEYDIVIPVAMRQESFLSKANILKDMCIKEGPVVEQIDEKMDFDPCLERFLPDLAAIVRMGGPG